MSYTVKEQRELIQAYEQGEEVEWRSINATEWRTLSSKEQFKESGYYEPKFDFVHNKYRVKQKRWRAEEHECYCYITPELTVIETNEEGYYVDGYRYKVGNYFRTWEQAEQARDLLEEALIKFHESL